LKKGGGGPEETKKVRYERGNPRGDMKRAREGYLKKVLTLGVIKMTGGEENMNHTRIPKKSA